MTGCGRAILVEAPDGTWPRFCVAPAHPAGTDHQIRFRGVNLLCPAGQTRIQTTQTDVDQPVLV